MNYVSTYKQERIFTLLFTNLSFLLHIHKNYNRRHLLARETGGNMCLALVIDTEHNRASDALVVEEEEGALQFTALL